jgi:nucleoside-diphosphate-sugar epimerase
MRVLLLGATGVVGAALRQALSEWGRVSLTAASSRGDVGAGVLAWRAGREEAPATLTRTRWDVVINSAARTDWNLPADEVWQSNVASVSALAPLVSADTHVIHLSTAFAPGRDGTVSSAELADYRNTYEWSKAAAERLVVERFGPATILRPPLIIGDSRTGAVARFSGIYQLISCAMLGLMPVCVAEPGATMQIVPVDAVVAEVLAAIDRGRPGATTTASMGAGSDAPTVEKSIQLTFDAINTWRNARALADAVAPPLIEPDRWTRFFLPFGRGELTARQLDVIDKLAAFRPYMTGAASFVPDVVVPGTADALAVAVRYWCDAHPRVAARTPRAWRA